MQIYYEKVKLLQASHYKLISWRFLCLNLLPDCSTDIAKYGYDVNFWFKRLMLDLLNPRLMIYLLSQMPRVPNYSYKKPPNLIRALQDIGDLTFSYLPTKTPRLQARGLFAATSYAGVTPIKSKSRAQIWSKPRHFKVLG